MTTDTKPTKKQAIRLNNELKNISQKIKIMIIYHNKRTSFFKLWNFIFNILNAVVGVSALFIIGWQLTAKTDSIIKISLSVASVTVLLLFFTMLFDFSKKQETHHWLTTIYMNYNKEITDMTLIIWSDLTEEDYRKWEDLRNRIKEDVSSLKKTEFPILEFEYLLCVIKAKIIEEKQGSLFLKVNWWYRSCANYFPMANARARFIAKHKYKG